MRLVVCDDDERDLQLVQSLVLNVKELEFLSIDYYLSGKDLLVSMSENSYEIFVLDIDMEGMDGLSLASEIRERDEKAIIIFLTNHDEYVFDSLRFMPYRYIRKRMIQKELPEALLSCKEKIEREQISFFIVGGGKELVKLSDILYVECQGHNLELHKKSGELLVREKISSFEKSFLQHGFVRVHKGFVVNMRYIICIKNKEIVLEGGILIKIGASYENYVKLTYNEYVRRSMYEAY